MVKYLIHHPVAVITVFLAVCILGIFSSGLLPVSLLPSINIPEITVQISHDNISASDLEQGIVSPIRSQLSQVSGLTDIQSEARDNQAIIHLKFNYGISTDYAFIEVNDKVDAAMASLPREVRRPKIIKASATDLPVFMINLRMKNQVRDTLSRPFMEMSMFAENVIKKRLEQLPEVAIVDISGTVSSELYIIPREDKVKSLGIGLDRIKQALDENNVNVGSINVREGLLQYNVSFRNELRTIEEIKNIYIKTPDRLLQLKEIADIGIRQQASRGKYLSQGQESICMAVIKSSNTQMSRLKEVTDRLIDQFKTDYPDMEFEISQDQTQLLEYTLANLRQDLILGCFLAIVIMLLFIRDLRSPLLISISIPVSLITCMLFFYFFHISINIVSLSGLILGVGMMIDNSVIVIDNISQHQQRGASLVDAIPVAVNEVVRPLISSFLTTCSVFIPLVFLSGIAGALFYDQAITVTIGLIVSLVVSITLIPTIYFLVHRGKGQGWETGFFEKLGLFNTERYYDRIFNYVYRYRHITMLLMFFILVIGVFLFMKIDKRQMPKFDQIETVAVIDWNENIHVDENGNRIKKLLLPEKQLIKQSNAFIGEQQFLLNRDLALNSSEAQVYLKASSKDNIEIVKKNLEETITKSYPEARITFMSPQSLFEKVLSTNEAQLTALVQKRQREEIPSLQEIEMIKNELNNKISGAGISNIPLKEQCVLYIKSEMLLTYNVDRETISAELQAAFNSYQIASLKSDERFLPIVLGASPKTLQQIINTTFVTNSKGVKIPVSALVEVKLQTTYRSVCGGKEGMYVPLTLNINHKQTPEAIEKIKAVVATHPDLLVSFTGSWFRNNLLIKEMGVILIVTLFLLYFILAAQFESFSLPLVVLLEIPIGLAGAVTVLYFSGNSINLMAMIGFIVMSGITINDSILKIDTINNLRKEGYSLEAAIHEGGRRRLKPILMTSLITVLALAPQMLGSDIGSKIQLPLSLSLLGGMFIGTPISLFVIPIAYMYSVKLGDKIRVWTRSNTYTESK